MDADLFSVHSPLMNMYAHFSDEAQVSVRLFFMTV